MRCSIRRNILVPLVLVSVQLGAPARAQDYPSKPVTIVLVLAPGTGLDVVARTYGDRLAQSFGSPVVFDNRPGANGIVAVNAVKSMPADGHALLVATSAALALNQTTFKQLPYDSAKDFIPVSLYLKSPFILIVHPSLPVRSVAELVKFVKRRRVPASRLFPGMRWSHPPARRERL